MIAINEQLDLFKLVGNELDEKVECVAIGGSAMMFLNAKQSTNDVDLVFESKKELEKVKKTLENIGFSEKARLVRIFKRYELADEKPVMMEGKGTRFDLFVNKVITFKISESIMSRIVSSHEFKNLVVKVISPEDIILLKSATEREKDRLDALELIKMFNIDWKIVVEECIKQTSIGGELFPIFLFDFLLELKEDYKAEIPKDVINKVREISEDMLVKAIKEGKVAREIKK